MIKDERNQNFMFLCHVLNNIDYPMEEKLIRSNAVLKVMKTMYAF